MPKRRRSSDDVGYSNQLKTFVDSKVICEKSISSEETMSKVYEKTKKLLWTGSKSCSKYVQPIGHHAQIPLELKKPDSGQLKIGSNGRLVHEKCPEELQQEAKGKTCSSCRGNPTNATLACLWCSCDLCPQCSRTCHVCMDTFCQLCSILDYQMSDERSCCLQCRTT